MLRQIELQLQNGPITKMSGVLLVTTFFQKYVPVLETLKKSYFDIYYDSVFLHKTFK